MLLTLPITEDGTEFVELLLLLLLLMLMVLLLLQLLLLLLLVGLLLLFMRMNPLVLLGCASESVDVRDIC